MIKVLPLFVLFGSLLFFAQPAYAQVNLQKRIEINLSTQHLYAYQGNQLIYSFFISSGTLRHPTVVGQFKPLVKLRSTEMIGGSKVAGDFYDLPNVPYVVYFYQGYAIHGTYWHNNFGHPMSHGCVNLRTADMILLYPWIDYNTTINIYGVTPAS